MERLATKRNGEVDGAKANVLMCILGCVQPRFTMDHLDKLMRQPPGAMARIAGAIMKLSGMSDDEEEDQGEA